MQDRTLYCWPQRKMLSHVQKQGFMQGAPPETSAKDNQLGGISDCNAREDKDDCEREEDNKSEETSDKLKEYERGEEYKNTAREFRICLPRSIRQWGGKDRHSKVLTSKGVLRDRRVRLSVSTAIRFYDVQDRLGFDQPSKAVEWLLDKAQWALENSHFTHTPSRFPPTLFTGSNFSKPYKIKVQDKCDFSKSTYTQTGSYDNTKGEYSLSPLISCSLASSPNNSHHNSFCKGTKFETNCGPDPGNHDANFIEINNNLAKNDLNLCDVSSFVGGAIQVQPHNDSNVGSNFVDINVIKSLEASNANTALEKESDILQYNQNSNMAVKLAVQGAEARHFADNGAVQNSEEDMENSVVVQVLDNMEEESKSSLKRARSVEAAGECRRAQLYKSHAAAASASDLQSPIVMINQASAYLCSTPPFMQATSSYLFNDIAGTDHASAASNSDENIGSPYSLQPLPHGS